MSRATPDFSVFTQCPNRAAVSSHKGSCKLCVSLVPDLPGSVEQQSVIQASGKEGWRGICIWHLAASALPLKISKMSGVPWRFFSPSVINYHVVEEIHRLAENTECWNIWKQLGKKYNHVKPIIQLKKKKSLLLQWETPSKRTQISMAF